MSDTNKPPHLILAPIRGITDCIYRSIAAAHFGGFDEAVAPFVSTVPAAKITDVLLKDLMPAKNAALPVAPQLLGKSADDFVRMAERLFDLGYDTVNLNMGCPFPQVANKGRGSGMLPDAGAVARFLEAAVPRMRGRLSIKLRLGRHDASEILALLPVFDRFDLVSLTIHPRLGRQMYTGRPDLAAFDRCLQLTRHPVIYNGDINCPADWQILADRFPSVAGWMIGRGALADPFLAAAVKGQAYPGDPAEVLRKFHHALMDAYRERLSGPGHLLDRMKGLWLYFSKGFSEGAAILRQVRKCRNLEIYEDTVARFFDRRPAWAPQPPGEWG